LFGRRRRLSKRLSGAAVNRRLHGFVGC